MERLIGNRGFKVVYHTGDRVRLIDGVERIPCTVVSGLKSRMRALEKKLGARTRTPFVDAYEPTMDTSPKLYPVQWLHGYEVILDTGERQFVLPRQIWKEADTGEHMMPGRIQHVEAV